MDLSELERLLAAATPGEWEYREFDISPDDPRGIVSDSPDHQAVVVESGMHDECDLRLISAARNALPELIAIARAVKAWGTARRRRDDMETDERIAAESDAFVECCNIADRLAAEGT